MTYVTDRETRESECTKSAWDLECANVKRTQTLLVDDRELGTCGKATFSPFPQCMRVTVHRARIHGHMSDIQYTPSG